MPDPTLDEFKQMVGEPDSTNTDTITLAPATQAALDESSRKLAASRMEPVEPTSAMQTPDFATKMGARPGVPFDSTSGISFMSRLRAAAQPTPAEEEKALKAAYPNGNVRRNQFGYLVVTKQGPDGKPVDVLADPIGLDIGDAAALIGELPKLAGAIFGSAGASKLPIAPGFWKSLASLVGMAGGGAAGGASQDVITRLLEGSDIQPSEIATRRGEGAVADAALGTALAAGTKAATLVVSPLAGSAGLPQTQARLAQAALKGKHGVEIELTPAELTGNAFLGRAEAMEMNKPGSQTVFQSIMKRREEAVTKLRNIITGGAVPDEEAAGQRALAALGEKTAPLTQNVEKAAQEAIDIANNEIISKTGAPVDKAIVGKAIDLGAKAQREAFETAESAKWNALTSDPAFTAPIIKPVKLESEVRDFLKTLPKVRKTVEEPTFDTYGNPTAKQVVKDVPVDTPIRPKLEEFASKLSGGKVSLNDLKGMRTDVGDALKGGEALTGVRDGRLSRLYSLLTDSIENGLDQVGKSPLKQAWTDAVAFTKAGHARFDRAGIAELFREPINAIGPHSLVDRAITSPDTYNAYKEFFGPTSTQVKGVQQAIRDQTLGLSDLSPSISAQSFISRLEALPQSIRQDVFGADAAKLRAAAQALRVAGGETLPAAELKEMMKSGNLSAGAIDKLITAQVGKSEAYRNELVKAVSEGNFKPDSIKATEFVDRMVFNKKTQPRDLSEITAMLHDRPEVLEDMRRLTFNRLLDDATVVSPSGTRVINGAKLSDALKDSQMVKRLKTALGASTFEDISNLADVLGPSATVHKAALTAGAFGGGAQTAQIVEHGSWAYVDRAIKNFVIAYAYTAPAARQYLGNQAIPTAVANKAVNAMIASTPFLEALGKQFGSRAERAAQQLNAATSGKAPQATEGDTMPSREEFMRAISEGTPVNR